MVETAKWTIQETLPTDSLWGNGNGTAGIFRKFQNFAKISFIVKSFVRK
jgi:hypothetical protein